MAAVQAEGTTGSNADDRSRSTPTPNSSARSRHGDVAWAVDQQPFLQGYLAVDSLWLYLNNRNTIGGGTASLTGPAFIDKSNIDAIAEYAANGTR